MKRTYWCALALAAMNLGVIGITEAQAHRISEVVSARANARAGGPLTEHDAWLLERYGALSGTPGYTPGGTRSLRALRKRAWRYHYRSHGYRR